MAAKKEETLYIRNGRPNRVVFHYASTRYMLEHRGNRKDSTALPAEANSDPEISRWLRNGQLEKISKDAFMKLGHRKVDILPNQYLKRDRVRNNSGKGELEMVSADSDTTRSKTQVTDKAVHKAVDPSGKWQGDLMSTDEELETMDYSQDDGGDYPSKYRDDDERRSMGY